MAEENTTRAAEDASEEPGRAPSETAAEESTGAAAGSDRAEQARAVSDEGKRGRLAAAGRIARDRRTVAGVAALLCVIAGAIASLLVARSLANGDESRARERFRAGAGEIASRLDLSLQREEDLTLAASTFFASDPKSSPAELAAWTRWAHILRRYPELQRLGLVAFVRASQLGAFAAQLKGAAVSPQGASAATAAIERLGASAAETSDVATATVAAEPSEATSLAAARGALKIVPAGSRPFYCLSIGELVRGPVPRAPAGIDYCARGQSLLAARDSGRAVARPLHRRPRALEVWTPVYRGVATPPTMSAREAAFVGWLRETLRPGVLAKQALAGAQGYALRLRYGVSPAAVVSVSAPPQQAQTATSRLRNGWTLQSFAPAAGLPLLSDGRAAWALAAGVLLSLLIGLAILLLAVRRPAPVVSIPAAGPVPQPQAESLYDPLTGTPARALTLDRAGRMLARAGRQSGVLAGALLIDIDWFKDVNEKLGRDAGDELLKIVAERLQNAMRSQDTVGRLGADKFVVLVETSAHGVRPDALAQRVIEALHRPVELESFGPSFFMTASIGVAFGRYESADDLLRDAELALRSAKAAGKDRYTLFNANMRSVIEGRGVLEAELNAALQDGQLFLLYEPIWDLSSRRVAAVEALLRWRHPKRGVLGPDEFMPLAEESGLIVPIGRWALEEACNRAAAWEVQGRRVGVCVKVADKQLSREGFITDIRRALQQSGVQPGLLTLEIAETAVMQNVAFADERLREVKRLGVKVAIDDFGASGYAYHSDLRKLPLDSLRVDRGSLAASDDEAYRNWLLEAILIVGRELSLAVVAKGVASQEQAGALGGMGCTMAQGLFMGEPVSAEGVVSLFDAELPVIPPQPTAMPTQPPVALISRGEDAGTPPR